MKYLIILMVLFGCLVRPVSAMSLGEYRQDLDTYRTAYADYEVKKGAYASTPTFASEEELIAAARTMLLDRAAVWTSYWQLMQETLNNLPRMTDKDKGELEKQIQAQLSFLESHKQKLESAKTRSALVEEAKVLNEQDKPFTSLSFLLNTHFVVNRMLAGADSVTRFNQALVKRIGDQDIPDSVKTSKLRGLSVSTERVNAIVEKLTQVAEDLTSGSAHASVESFEDINQEIGPLYPELKQQLNTTIELSKGVEW